ncbi:MAG: AMP-binding protein [Spirochaetaceae bacterium]|nr:AMP-binding protein [Spirochaetaceae bacterium]
MDLDRAYSRIADRSYEDFRAFLDAAAARGGSRTAFRWRPEGAESERLVSFAELKAQADGVGSFLLARGFARGDRVAILAENRPEWCVAYLAIVAAGLVAVPLDATLDEGGVLRNLGAARCRALFVSEKLARRLPGLEAFRAGAGLDLVVDFDLAPSSGAGSGAGTRGGQVGQVGQGGSAAGRLSWAEVAATPASSLLPKPGEIGAKAAAVVFFTSGTTGIAKGITLNHGAVIANVNASRMSLLVTEEDVFIAMLPLHHTYATTCSFLSGVEAGSTVVVVDRIAPSAVLRAVREGGVTFLIGVPLLFDKVRAGIEAELAKLPGPLPGLLKRALALSRFMTLRLGLPIGRLLFKAVRAKASLGSVRLAVSGGGPLAPATADFFDALGINLVQGYGMSENGPLISVNLPERKDNRSVGFPVKRTELRIFDPGPDGIGEIQVRSPSLMDGYLDNPEASAEAFTDDGWLKTGDLGRVDRRGFVFITGRRKSLIVTEGGKNVYPEEVEGRFEGAPWIKEVLVVGRPARSGHPGEEVVAVFVPDYEAVELAHPGRSGDASFVAGLLREELFRVNKTLPAYMKPCDFLVKPTEFEKTSTRKIKRFLYQEYARRPS